jgi:hypothetical protein
MDSSNINAGGSDPLVIKNCLEAKSTENGALKVLVLQPALGDNNHQRFDGGLVKARVQQDEMRNLLQGLCRVPANITPTHTRTHTSQHQYT